MSEIFFNEFLFQCIVDVDIVVCLHEELGIELFEVDLEFFIGAFFENVLAVDVDDGYKGLLYDFEVSFVLQFLPNEHQISEVQNPNENTQKRFCCCQFDDHLGVTYLLLTIMFIFQ